MFRVLVQALRVCLQKGSHLVDERTCAARTGSVHSLLNIAVFKINDFRVFATKFNSDIGFRSDLLYSSCLCDNLLLERDAEMIRERKTAGTCDHGVNHDVSELFLRFDKQCVKGLTDFGVVAAVFTECQTVRSIHDCDFDGCRTDINA